MDNYWTPKHDEAIRQYYHADTIADRNRIIDRVLSTPLYDMAYRGLVDMGVSPCCEHTQDIVIHLVHKVLPKLTEDKLQGALQYLWTSTRNYIITYIRPLKTHQTISLDELTYCMGDQDIDAMNIYCSEAYVSRIYMTDIKGPTVDAIDLDADNDRQTVRDRIMSEIDLRLKGQHIVNTTNSVFLLLLRQYIVDNDYDVRGFGPYVMGAMHLKLSTYRVIAGRLGMRTRDFNEKLIK